MHRLTFPDVLTHETLGVLCQGVNAWHTTGVTELVNHVLAGTAHVLRDRRAELVLEELYVDTQRAADEARGSGDAGDFGFGCGPAQGEFLYLWCRSTEARTAVQTVTSAGYLAAALRDNGGGIVVTADSLPGQLGPVDVLAVDGWPDLAEPSLALRVLELVQPRLRRGAGPERRPRAGLRRVRAWQLAADLVPRRRRAVGGAVNAATMSVADVNAGARRRPTAVAHTGQLPEAGSFVTADAAGTPLLLVRQDDGSVRTLANVRRHRGARVETEPSGRRKVFACPYHRWCYTRTGAIRSIPFDDGFTGVPKADLGLIEHPSVQAGNLMWVVPDRSRPPADVAAACWDERVAWLRAAAS